MRIAYADGTNEINTYDVHGQLVSSTDRQSRVTRYEYDAMGQQLSTCHPNGAVNSRTFDAVGRVKSWRRPDLQSTRRLGQRHSVRGPRSWRCV